MTDGRQGGDRDRSWGFRAGLAVSAALHAALALFMWSGRAEVPLPPPPETSSERITARWPDALRVVPIPTPELPEAEEEEPAEAPTRTGLPAAEPVPAGEGAAAAEVPGAELSNAERLQPRIGDPRLWSRAPIDSLAPGLQERYDRAETALRRLLKTYLDSLALSEEQRRRAREWVFGEGDEKWGISPDGLHLGDVTIPIPFGQLLQQSGPARRQAEQVLRTWEMIQFQAGRIEAQEVREERLEVIRERTRERLRDAAADSSARDTSGG